MASIIAAVSHVELRVTPADHALVIDQEERSLHIPLVLLQDAVAAADLFAPVRQQRELEVAQAVRKSPLGPDVVHADPEHLHVGLGDLVVIPSQGGELFGSTRAEGQGEER